MGNLNGAERLRNRINGRVLPSTNGKAKRSKATQNGVKSWGTLNHFYLEAMKDLTRSEIAAFVVIWSVEREQTAAVSLTMIQRCGGMSRPAAQSAVKSLLEKKLIVRVSKGSNISNQSSVYRTATPTPPQG